MSTRRLVVGETVRFQLGPRKGQLAEVIARAAYSDTVDSIDLRLSDGTVTYAYSDSVEIVP